MNEVKPRTKDSLLTDENRAESARLKEIYKKADHGYTQAAFGEAFGIGNQGAVWQCLNAKGMPISLKAAKGFARGLNCQIADFSPRLAKEMAEMAAGLGVERESPPPHFVAEPKVQYMAEKRPSGVILQLAELLQPMDETDRKMCGAILADLVSNPGRAEQMAAKFERILGGDRDSQAPREQRFGV